MTNVENNLLRQMQKMRSALSSVQGAVEKENPARVSFQDMMLQSGSGKAVASIKQADEPGPVKKPIKEQAVEDAPEEGKLSVVKNQDEEELKPENLAGNPNAVMVMDMFRPEIVETAGEQPVEIPLDPIPEEAIPEAAMDLGGQEGQMETTVDTSVGAEVSMEQQPKDFGQAMEEAPAQEQPQSVPVQQEAAPEVRQTAEEPSVQEPAVKADKSQLPEGAEIRTENVQDDGETGGEAVAEETPVFHEAQAVPVKVGERYETVDTQQPEMDAKLANTIHNAVQAGGERIQIQLAPQNLGSLVIEMTKDVNGALQVVLHTSSAKTAGVLNQHLDGLHNALLGYGHEEIHVEVQRSQESQEQHLNKQADPDGRGQQQRQQHQERREDSSENGQEFLQKLRLGLFGGDL